MKTRVGCSPRMETARVTDGPGQHGETRGRSLSHDVDYEHHAAFQFHRTHTHVGFGRPATAARSSRRLVGSRGEPAARPANRNSVGLRPDITTARAAVPHRPPQVVLSAFQRSLRRRSLHTAAATVARGQSCLKALPPRRSPSDYPCPQPAKVRNCEERVVACAIRIRRIAFAHTTVSCA